MLAYFQNLPVLAICCLVLSRTCTITVVAFTSSPHNNAFGTKYRPTLISSSQPPCHQHTTTTTLSLAKDYDEYIPSKRAAPSGGDMAYIRPNIARQAEIYNKIRQVGGVDCVNDVYARDPKQEEFWFVGKVSRCSGIVTINQCIARQLNLIEEHATRVRPIELGRSFGNIEIWVAPGDTEFQMSQNDPNIVLTKMARYVDGCENIPNDQVGFVAEVVTNHGEGFRVVRNGKDGTVPPYLIGEG